MDCLATPQRPHAPSLIVASSLRHRPRQRLLQLLHLFLLSPDRAADGLDSRALRLAAAGATFCRQKIRVCHRFVRIKPVCSLAHL